MSWLGYFYGGNLAGAVTGSLLAGFYLLRVYDMPTATMVAVALNVLVAVIALAIARVMGHHPAPVVGPARRESGVSLVYVAIALSGMTALGAEVIWTRLLSLLFGATTYTFSLILAVFLTGLGIGSSIGSHLAKRFPHSRAALGVCQLLLCVAIAWAAHTMGASLPYWPINPSIGKNPVFQFDLDLLRSLWVILPAATLWGASFPLAIGAAAQGAGHGPPGRRRLRRQYRWRHHRCAGDQPRAGRSGRQPGRAAGVDWRVSPFRVANAHQGVRFG